MRKFDMRLGDLGLKTKIIVQGAFPIILLAALSVVCIVSLRYVLQSVKAVDETYSIIGHSKDIQADALNMQTGLRGFLLTGNEEFLVTFKEEEARLEVGFTALGGSIRHAILLKTLQDAQQTINEWKKQVAVPSIALRREVSRAKGMDDLGQFVAQGKGKTHFEAFREQTGTFIDRERARMNILEGRIATATTSEQWQRLLKEVNNSHLAVEQAIGSLAAAVDMESALRGYLLTGKEGLLEPYKEGTRRLFELIQEQKKIAADDADQVTLIEQMETGMEEWVKDVIEPEIALRKSIAGSKTMADLHAWVGKGDDKRRFDRFKELMATFQSGMENLMKERRIASDDTVKQSERVIVGGTVIIALGTFLISYLLAGTITRPILNAVSLAEGISSGNLSGRLNVTTGDEIGRLGLALNAMADSLRKQTGRIREGVNILVSSASEIAATVSQLAASASKTSAAVSETTTTVEQVKQAAKLCNDKAKKVSESALQAVQISQQGKLATDEAVHGMHQIKEQMESIGETVMRLSEQSQAIERIIDSVQDLADQSNLLAVNASIEAARAGDQGKGFTVVAHEIKNLADQSKEATGQIRAILEETRKWVDAVVKATDQGTRTVEEGVERSALSGHSIQALAQSVTESSQAAAIIDSSTLQQFEGVEQVADAMANIETAMHQNLTGTSQLESAARRLEELGGELRDLVQKYRI